MTTAQLAAEFGISMKEMHALCAVAKVKFTGPDQELKAGQVDRIRDMIEGRVPMKGPKVKAPVNPLKPILIGAALAGVLLVGWVVYQAAEFINRPASITVRAGQCFDDPGLLGAEIDPVSCDGPYDYRAFATIDLDEVWSAWPGLEQIEARANERCQILADSNVSAREIYFFGPVNERTWDDEKARRIVCAVRN